MESFEAKLKDSKDKIYVADHMLTNTYGLLKDSKILLAIIDNISLAFEGALSAFLEHERLFKRISSYNKTPESELNFFLLKVKSKYDFDTDLIDTYVKLREILAAHKDSSMEFSRKGNFVIANEEYDLTKITPEDIKKDIKSCKDFLAVVEKNITELI